MLTYLLYLPSLIVLNIEIKTMENKTMLSDPGILEKEIADFKQAENAFVQAQSRLAYLLSSLLWIQTRMFLVIIQLQFYIMLAAKLSFIEMLNS